MKTTLEKTINLAKSGVIGDYGDIHRITSDFLRLKLPELEAASNMFNFVRSVLQNSPDSIYYNYNQDSMTLQDILLFVDEFRKEGEIQLYYAGLRNIAVGIQKSDSIPIVRKFKYISLSKFVKNTGFKEYMDLTYMSRKYTDSELNDRMSMGDLLQKLTTEFSRSWNMAEEIENYRDRLNGCSEILALLFLKCL